MRVVAAVAVAAVVVCDWHHVRLGQLINIVFLKFFIDVVLDSHPWYALLLLTNSEPRGEKSIFSVTVVAGCSTQPVLGRKNESVLFVQEDRKVRLPSTLR